MHYKNNTVKQCMQTVSFIHCVPLGRLDATDVSTSPL